MKKYLILLSLLIPILGTSQRLGGFRIGSDADATSYLGRVTTAGGSYSNVQQNGVVSFFLSTKGHGLYSTLYDAGFMVWAVANANAETLKGVNDITWNGGIVHASTGVTGNGTTGYGDLNFTASGGLTLNNSQVSIYSRSNLNLTSIRDISARNGTTSEVMILARTATNFITDQYNSTSGQGRVSASQSTSAGFFVSSRISGTDLRAFANGSQIGSTATGTPIGTLPAFNMVIMADNNAGTISLYSTREYTFWSAGTGLTSSQVTNFSDDSNQLMRVFGLNVY